jgi:hypothetical protein
MGEDASSGCISRKSFFCFEEFVKCQPWNKGEIVTVCVFAV